VLHKFLVINIRNVPSSRYGQLRFATLPIRKSAINAVLDSVRKCVITYCLSCLLRDFVLRQNYRPVHVCDLYIMYVLCVYTLVLDNNI
jgi:hypothetical protein